MLNIIYSQTKLQKYINYYCLPVVSTGEVETDSELSVVAIVMVILR